jgi:hypothetical protein
LKKPLSKFEAVRPYLPWMLVGGTIFMTMLLRGLVVYVGSFNIHLR